MSHRIQVEPGGAVVEAAEGQTILDACLKAGVWLPYACLHGRCATCKVQVTEGQVEQGDASPFALMEMEREEGKCLACCAMPTSDLVTEAEALLIAGDEAVARAAYAEAFARHAGRHGEIALVRTQAAISFEKLGLGPLADAKESIA